MPHVDPDVLALLALGEPVASDAEQRHLAECAVCTTALEELRATAEVGRASRTAGPLLAPPPRVWEGIAAELGLPRDLRPGTATTSATVAGKSMASRSARAEPTEARRPPVRLERRRDRGRFLLAAVLVAAAVVLLPLGLVALQSALSPPRARVVAEAELEAFPDWPDARGAAVLEELPDGTRQVEVTLDAEVGDDGFREVWLIRSDASDLVSLGVLEGSEGTFEVPNGVDVDEFNLVDVSEEPQDGDPAHSGDSIVRGPLT